ncbi:hypothetical protein M0R45_006286 [Rubus argutus]|uniref:Uncharacterized protein n=1 Tax=Rubus argutus TaxID=59490 RepID=A0AAW1YQD1_RUBAR
MGSPSSTQPAISSKPQSSTPAHRRPSYCRRSQLLCRIATAITTTPALYSALNCRDLPAPSASLPSPCSPSFVLCRKTRAHRRLLPPTTHRALPRCINPTGVNLIFSFQQQTWTASICRHQLIPVLISIKANRCTQAAVVPCHHCSIRISTSLTQPAPICPATSIPRRRQSVQSSAGVHLPCLCSTAVSLLLCKN